MHCRDDADTDIVKQCLEHFLKGTVEVRVEFSDISIMLTHHCHPHKQHLITDTTLNGNYCVKETFLSLAYIYTHRHIYIIYLYIYTHTHTRTHICAWIYIHMHKYAYTYAYTYMHTCI